ncbi:MAG: FGGY-family carbohydrate kinase [Atribacterota bacterium]
MVKNILSRCQMALLGIDVGTTNTKVLIYDETGNRQAENSFPTPFYPDLFGGRYRPEEIFQKLVDTIRMFPSDSKKEIVALSISSFAEVMVGLDESMQPITKSLVWYDSRTEPQFQEMKKVIDDSEVYARTGISPQHKYSFYKMLWHRQNEKEIFDHVRHWTSMSGYLLGALSGVLSCDYSLASRTMLFEQQTGKWSDELVSLTGVSAETMPPLVPSGLVLGTIKKEVAQATGLPEEVQVVTGGHDHLCAALSVGVFHRGRVLISTGTTESLTMARDEAPKIELKSMERPFTWGHHTAYPAYYTMNGIYSGGYSVDWMLNILGDSYPCFETLPFPRERKIPIFFPYLLGADYEGARGAFVNLEGSMAREELLQGVMASLCFEYKNVWDVMQNALSITVDQITNVGGGTHNQYWMKMKATVLDHSLVVPRDREGSSKGAALLAGIGSGVYTNPDDAFQKTFHIERIIEPVPEMKEFLQKWYRFYTVLREDIQSLNQKMKRLMNDEE